MNRERVTVKISVSLKLYDVKLVMFSICYHFFLHVIRVEYQKQILFGALSIVS